MKKAIMFMKHGFQPFFIYLILNIYKMFWHFGSVVICEMFNS